MGAWTSPLTRGCADVVPCGRVQSGPGCGSSHLGRGSWGKGGGGYGVGGHPAPPPYPGAAVPDTWPAWGYFPPLLLKWGLGQTVSPWTPIEGLQLWKPR